MGPFVPDIISDQLNLVVALIIGIGFGAVLEQAGFSSSRKLAGVFYGYDFTVLRVFFTAAVTAMSGVLLLDYAGLLDMDIIYVNPTWLMPAIVGGAIMGLGFIIGGYCPGTSVCAAAIGKVDAMMFVGGGLFGVFAFGELFPLCSGFNDSTDLGPITVFDSLGVSRGMFALGLIAVAVVAFAVTTVIEKRVNPDSAPSLIFNRKKHVAAAVGLLLLGMIFILVPDRKTYLLAMASDESTIESHPAALMTSDELAFRIVDKEPRLRILDLRPVEVPASIVLPGAVNMTARDLFSKDANRVLGERHAKKVFVASTQREENIAWQLARELGFENCAILEGGIEGFRTTILDSTTSISSGTRWDADVNTFRKQARIKILGMIELEKNGPKAETKKVKKVQGGC